MGPPQLLNRLVRRPREFNGDVHPDHVHQQGTGGGPHTLYESKDVRRQVMQGKRSAAKAVGPNAPQNKTQK